MIRSQRTTVIVAILLLLAQIVSAQVERFIPGNALAGVTPGPDGRLYGVTYGGETSPDKGKLYSVDTGLTNTTTHYDFNSAVIPAGAPSDELVFDSASGKFFGTTLQGGTNDGGLIFSYTPGASTVVVVRSDFGAFSQPQGPLVVSSGYIFGAVGRGGVNGGGAVFRMAIDGTGFTILHEFADFGSLPQALTLGGDGNLYGVTLFGGIPCPSQPNLGCGTVFRLRRVLPGDTNINFQTLFQFHFYFTIPCPPSDPFCIQFPSAHNSPQRTVIYGSDGWIYGQTHFRVFRLNPSNPTTTFQFVGPIGGGVSMSTIEGSDGRLYVADYGGGPEGAGRIYSMNRDGTAPLVFRTFSFATGLTAYGPYGKLYRSATGSIYGTTEYTNSPSPFRGTVFSVQSPPQGPPKIAFTSERDGNEEIYLMNPDGSGQTRLTNNPAGDFFPSLSSDGNRIAFVSNQDGSDVIYKMNVDGSNQVALTTTASQNTQPSFSPDGQQIVFVSNRAGNRAVYVMNSDGLNQVRVTNVPTGVDSHPSFSPDGQFIVFTSVRPGLGENIYKIGLGGSGEVQLTSDPVSASDAVFSSDGTKIFFVSMRHGNAQIYVMNSDGSGQVRLTNNTSFDLEPTYSPTGNRIAFSSFRDGNAEIYTMNPDGSNQTRVTTVAARDALPSWGGQGASIPPTPPPVKAKLAGGNILVGSPGDGLILKSPGGNTCVKIGIDNAGALTNVIVPCP